jgi:hypothetical protein
MFSVALRDRKAAIVRPYSTKALAGVLAAKPASDLSALLMAAWEMGDLRLIITRVCDDHPNLWRMRFFVQKERICIAK